MNEILNVAGQVFRAVIVLAGVLLHDYLRYRQRHGSRKPHQRLRRLTPAQRRARYVARRQRRRRPNTGSTQRLDTTSAPAEARQVCER